MRIEEKRNLIKEKMKILDEYPSKIKLQYKEDVLYDNALNEILENVSYDIIKFVYDTYIGYVVNNVEFIKKILNNKDDIIDKTYIKINKYLHEELIKNKIPFNEKEYEELDTEYEQAKYLFNMLYESDVSFDDIEVIITPLVDELTKNLPISIKEELYNINREYDVYNLILKIIENDQDLDKYYDIINNYIDEIIECNNDGLLW